jgi:hypothetical protein
MKHNKQEAWTPIDLVQGHVNQTDELDRLTNQLLQTIANKVYISSTHNTKHSVQIDLTGYPSLIIDRAVDRWKAEYLLDELILCYCNNKARCMELHWYEANNNTMQRYD